MGSLQCFLDLPLLPLHLHWDLIILQSESFALKSLRELRGVLLGEEVDWGDQVYLTQTMTSMAKIGVNPLRLLRDGHRTFISFASQMGAVY